MLHPEMRIEMLEKKPPRSRGVGSQRRLGKLRNSYPQSIISREDAVYKQLQQSSPAALPWLQHGNIDIIAWCRSEAKEEKLPPELSTKEKREKLQQIRSDNAEKEKMNKTKPHDEKCEKGQTRAPNISVDGSRQINTTKNGKPTSSLLLKSHSGRSSYMSPAQTRSAAQKLHYGVRFVPARRTDADHSAALLRRVKGQHDHRPTTRARPATHDPTRAAARGSKAPPPPREHIKLFHDAKDFAASTKAWHETREKAECAATIRLHDADDSRLDVVGTPLAVSRPHTTPGKYVTPAPPRNKPAPARESPVTVAAERKLPEQLKKDLSVTSTTPTAPPVTPRDAAPPACAACELLSDGKRPCDGGREPRCEANGETQPHAPAAGNRAVRFSVSDNLVHEYASGDPVSSEQKDASPLKSSSA